MVHRNNPSRVREILSGLKYYYQNHGLRTAIDEALNQSQIWNWRTEILKSVSDGTTSISDGTDYIEVCKSAFLTDETFANYKSCKQYRDVLEHCSFELGLKYLRCLRSNSESLKVLSEVTKNDFGKPFRYTYPTLGRVSPTQIRYAKVLQDLTYLFGPLDKMVVSEIGIGFGGQAIQILHSNEQITYQLFDLEWPAKLGLKNIEFIFNDKAKNASITDWTVSHTSDLVISNYAFSELTRETQDIYLDNVIANSKKRLCNL